MVSSPPITPSDFRCIGCGYDLTGATIGGACPECGTAVHSSLRANAGERSSTNATISLVMGILGLAACGPCGIVAIIFYYRAKRELDAGGFSPSSRSMAMAGLVLGIISTAMVGLLAAFLAFMLAFS